MKTIFLMTLLAFICSSPIVAVEYFQEQMPQPWLAELFNEFPEINEFYSKDDVRLSYEEVSKLLLQIKNDTREVKNAAEKILLALHGNQTPDTVHGRDYLIEGAIRKFARGQFCFSGLSLPEPFFWNQSRSKKKWVIDTTQRRVILTLAKFTLRRSKNTSHPQLVPHKIWIASIEYEFLSNHSIMPASHNIVYCEKGKILPTQRVYIKDWRTYSLGCNGFAAPRAYSEQCLPDLFCESLYSEAESHFAFSDEDAFMSDQSLNSSGDSFIVENSAESTESEWLPE